MSLPGNSSNFSMFETFPDANSSDAENGTNATVFDYVTEHVVHALSIYYTPLLVTLGSIGNLLSVFVFFTSKLRHQSTSQYLSALAISDTIFLLQLLPPWLNTLMITDIFISEGFCQVFTYISYVTCYVSSWLVVSFTVERFVAVLYPLRRNIICTVARARHIIISIAVTAVLLATPVLRFAVPINANCDIDEEYIDSAMIFNWADTVVSFTIPLTIIMVLNAWIMSGVWKLERARQHMGGDERGMGRARPARLFGCPRSQQRITRMLLIVSTVFVVLNLPAYTMRIIVYTNQKNTGYSGRWHALQQVAMMSFHTNFGINFILYCMSGQNFRRALRQAIPYLRRRPQRGVAVRRTESCHPARASSVSTSFVSCTEATSNCAVSVSTPAPRHRRRDTFIKRWTFDNSRQRQQATAQRNTSECIDMEVFRSYDA
ncbi:thyrotropin-releasing hormone receptor [Plodia interpunctella]|uniref:thyrotropin-releasing hormone receptor n=1 Tax=Plodia interpunctella TaxID=58824 RepID=UPI002367DA66|nr:thyrotropin-releasing hormone receptor [Plodia interpunctella]